MLKKGIKKITVIVVMWKAWKDGCLGLCEAMIRVGETLWRVDHSMCIRGPAAGCPQHRTHAFHALSYELSTDPPSYPQILATYPHHVEDEDILTGRPKTGRPAVV